MRYIALLLLLALVVPYAVAQEGYKVAIYTDLPVESLAESLNAKIVGNLTDARDADVIIVMAKNVSDSEAAVIRRLLESGGLVILCGEPMNNTYMNDLLKLLELPSLFYNDRIFDYIKNDGNPGHPVVNGSVLLSSSLVDRSDAIRKRYTYPSAIGVTNSSVRETGKLVRGEEIKAKRGYLAVFGGSEMFSDEAYNSTHTRFQVNGDVIKEVVKSFLSEKSEGKNPELPLIGKYLMLLAAAFVFATLLRIKRRDVFHFMRALFIGRFQPFHRGHFKAVRRILERESSLTIVVAAAQYSHSLRNPFTAGERVEMIHNTIREYLPDADVVVIPVVDIEDNALRVRHLERMLPPFRTVYSNNPLVRQLFKEAGYEVSHIPLFNRKERSAKRIRELIIKESPERVRYVPRPVVEVVTRVIDRFSIFRESDEV